MRKNIFKIIVITIVLLVIIGICSFSKTYAAKSSGLSDTLEEYTEEYQNWLELSDEEKSETLEPRKYDVIVRKDNTTYLNELTNVFKLQRLLTASVSDSYDLRDIIPENVTIKNQASTNACWAFTTIGVLESNLAIRDYILGNKTTTYNFSERHMYYTTTKRAFLNDEENEYGFARSIGSGGNFYIASQYLTNGQGAINESDMPFEDTEEYIDISEIQNKEVVTTLYDTVEFPELEADEREQIMDSMKEHIMNYGGLYAGMHGVNLQGDCYNNETGAIYCTDDDMDHTVIIIGWDDDYQVSDFNENQRPSENGAWIIKNSWGESISESLSDLKAYLYNNQVNSNWTSVSDVTNSEVLEYYQNIYGEDKVSISNDELVLKLGDSGYMYVSYEDCNIYKSLMGIEKATNFKDYDSVYQNDMLGASGMVSVLDSGNIYLANVFTRDSSQQETLDKISIYTFQGYTCKVYVNPNSDSKAKEDLQEVTLAEGDSVSFEAGYHVIEFAEPIELTGDAFVVVVEVEDEGETRYIALEAQIDDTAWQEAEVNEGESFYTNEERLENNDWDDIGATENIEGNLCIKAYTTYSEEETTDQDDTDSGDETTNPDDTEEDTNSGDETTNPDDTDDTEDTETGTGTIDQEGTEELAKPVLSDFSNVKAEITDTELYYTSGSTDASGTIEITITGIVLGDETNTYTYYYYISGTQGDENITDWTQTEISQESDGTYTIVLTLDVNEYENNASLLESDNLFVYIREVAEINGQSAEQIVTLSVDNEVEAEIYVDETLVGGVNEVLNYSTSGSTSTSYSSQTDNTVASTSLPDAGSVALKIVFVVLILVFGSFAYYKYKNIDR